MWDAHCDYHVTVVCRVLCITVENTRTYLTQGLAALPKTVVNSLSLACFPDKMSLPKYTNESVSVIPLYVRI